MDYSLMIGRKVFKTSGKPFKSKKLVNTVKAVITHPILGIPAFTFEEDNSFVECRRVNDCSPLKWIDELLVIDGKVFF